MGGQVDGSSARHWIRVDRPSLFQLPTPAPGPLGEADHAALQKDLDEGVYDLNKDADFEAASEIDSSADQSTISIR